MKCCSTTTVIDIKNQDEVWSNKKFNELDEVPAHTVEVKIDTQLMQASNEVVDYHVQIPLPWRFNVSNW